MDTGYKRRKLDEGQETQDEFLMTPSLEREPTISVFEHKQMV
jgi:hypothetical protein